MKTCFTAVAIAFFGCTVLAGEEASVLVNKPAPTPAVSAPACENCTPNLICVDGQCGSRLYSVQSEEHAACRNRLFGGHVVRKSSRTVVKPVRR